MKQSVDRDAVIWSRLVRCHQAYAEASREFLASDVDRVKLVRRGLHGRDRSTALFVLKYMKAVELEQLFGDLVFLASFSHGAVHVVHNAILSLPRKWVLTNIETVAEPLLEKGTYDEYRRLLELYVELDHKLALKLGHRAIRHADPDIREAGEDFLGRLNQRCEAES
jgi:hypothetical protein